MTDDLTTRLRDGSVTFAEMRVAADRIEALEARIVTLQGEQVAGVHFMQERDARDAVIAEADARYHAAATQQYRGFEVARDMHAILSRVPQGAAERERSRLVAVIDFASGWVGDLEARGRFIHAAFEAFGVPQGAAEPTDADLGAFDGAEAQFGLTAEPWTDPEPFVSPDGHSRRDSTRWMGWHARPRTRERYDAEEGNRG